MIANVHEVILEDRRQTIHDVCNCAGLSYGSCQRNLAEELNMKGLRCGRTETGCCTMTMRLHTPRSLWGNSWQKITGPLFPTLPTHLTWPRDFYVFPNMKLWLKGWSFVSIEDIQAESQQVLSTLTPADFNECFQKRQNRWNCCMQAQGDYFEGDGGN